MTKFIGDDNDDEDDDEDEDDNDVPFLPPPRAHLRLPNYYS